MAIHKQELDKQAQLDAPMAKDIRTCDDLSEEGLPDGITETKEEKQQGWFVGSIDQGTTSTRFIIFNGHGEPVASHQIEFENKYPQSGYACYT